MSELPKSQAAMLADKVKKNGGWYELRNAWGGCVQRHDVGQYDVVPLIGTHIKAIQNEGWTLVWVPRVTFPPRPASSKKLLEWTFDGQDGSLYLYPGDRVEITYPEVQRNSYYVSLWPKKKPDA